MKAFAVLLLLPLSVMAGQADVKREIAEAERWLQEIYLSNDAEKYCHAHPRGTYPARYAGREIKIDCSTRNRWVELYRSGKLPQV